MSIIPGVGLPLQTARLWHHQVAAVCAPLSSNALFCQGFEGSLTRTRKHIEILLLIQALAPFVRVLVGRLGEQREMNTSLAPRGVR